MICACRPVSDVSNALGPAGIRPHQGTARAACAASPSVRVGAESGGVPARSLECSACRSSQTCGRIAPGQAGANPRREGNAGCRRFIPDCRPCPPTNPDAQRYSLEVIYAPVRIRGGVLKDTCAALSGAGEGVQEHPGAAHLALLERLSALPALAGCACGGHSHPLSGSAWGGSLSPRACSSWPQVPG
jgi:hypothetical protein